MVLYIVFGLIALILIYAIAIYNALVTLKTRVNEAWSDIEVQMKLRYNLIPNLVETVKGYATHEAGVLQEVTNARAQAVSNQGSPEDQAQSENLLQGALRTLFAVAEDYPDLKANENFMGLQHDLSEVEDKIQAARRFYNGNVRNNNIKVEQFPSDLVAGTFRFARAEFFELDEEDAAARQPVDVNFN